MTLDHATIEELAAADALGGLDQADREELDRFLVSHGACEECRRIRREFDEVAAALALSLEPVAPSAGIADRILATDRSEDVAERETRRPSRRWGTLAVAAALAVALVIASLFARGGPRPVTLASGQTFTTFQGPAGGGELTLAYTPGRNGAFVWGDGLSDPGAGHVYEIWMIEGETPVSGGCVRPTGGRLALFVDASLDDTDVMAVTREDASCPSAPTTPPIFVAELV